MSRVVMPRAYRAMMRSLNPSRRVWPLRTICGSKLPSRSRGTSRSTPPISVSTACRWRRCGCCPTRGRPDRVSHSPGARSSPQPAPARAPPWSPGSAAHPGRAAPPPRPAPDPAAHRPATSSTSGRRSAGSRSVCGARSQCLSSRVLSRAAFLRLIVRPRAAGDGPSDHDPPGRVDFQVAPAYGDAVDVELEGAARRPGSRAACWPIQRVMAAGSVRCRKTSSMGEDRLRWRMIRSRW